MTRNNLIFLVFILLPWGCSGDAPEAPGVLVERIGNDFVHGYFSQFPEEVYEVGYPDAPTDRFGDHSTRAIAVWDAKVDGWIEALDAIDPASLAGTPAAVTYVFARERLQALVDRRICRMQLWSVSPTWTGWQYMVVSTLAVQSIDSEQQRDEALRLAADIERFVQTDISNLRKGQDQGYLAATSNVSAVIEQISVLIDSPVEESPFMSPAGRSGDDAFSSAYQTDHTVWVLLSHILPMSSLSR